MSGKPTYQELEQKIQFLVDESDKRARSEELNRVLFKISKAVSTSASLYDFFKTTHLALSHVIDTTIFFIALYHPENDSITFPYVVDTVDKVYPRVIEISKTSSLTAEVIRTRKPLLTTKSEVLNRWAKSDLAEPKSTPSEIWLGVPLQVKGKMLGVMSLQNYDDPECYDQADLDLMVSVAELVAVAIENIVAEKSLQESEARFRSIFNLAVGGILMGSSEGIIIEANKHMCELSGRKPEELIGKHISQLAFTKESVEKFPFRFDLLNKGLKVSTERVLIRPDGSEVPIEMCTKRMPDGSYHSIFSDITERRHREKTLREAEERFRLAFLTSPDAIAINKMDGTYVDINEGFTELTGYTREEVIGQSSTDIGIWDIPEDRRRIMEGLQRDGRVKNLESRFLLKDGTTKISLLSANIIQLNGEPHILSVTRDISLLKKTEKEKYDLEVKYMQSQKMEAIGTMAGGIAHDFNNMLAIILGNAEMALLEIPDENRAKHCINQIVTASQRVKELVKQILTFSRQSDQQLLPINLYSTVDDSLNMLRSAIPTTVSIVRNFSKDCDTILADPTQIHQLLMNICYNAVHAMDEKGTLEITGTMVHLQADDIAHQPHLQPGNFIKLSISDTGVGMAKDIQGRIFEPFYTTKGVTEGTGMGLAIVLGIVNSHGGFIQVSSEPGEGTEFSIYFPALEIIADEKKDEVSENYSPRSERILLVDDETMLAVIGGSLLERLGYKVTIKTNSNDALNIFKSDPEAFDLVITDQSMPNMSGVELSMELLKSRSDIPIILCTGYSKKITKEKAKELGIRGYLTKPFNINQLDKIVRNVLAKQ